jgi:phenylalanyl-tRNA synthetase alpha chain
MDLELKSVESEAFQAIEAAGDLEQLEQIRLKYLGKKGVVTGLLRSLGSYPVDQRPKIGQMINTLRDSIETRLNQAFSVIEAKARDIKFQQEAIDVTMPGRVWPMGKRHPLTLTLDEIKKFFIGYSFEVVEGPEVETDYYNFEALNVPKDHPARDMQDTFYLAEELLLRTQTSPVQVRTMEAQQPPVRIIAPGKVYRVDADATHTPMFHQVEGLLVDRNVTFGDLKGILTAFAHSLFGENRGVRFRPSYFPFTEPSAEMDISCMICGGLGCRTCSNEGWIEILGAGMVHPNVLEMAGYDSEQFQGFAFGMGVERVTMLKYGLDDIRLLFENDPRLLMQF